MRHFHAFNQTKTGMAGRLGLAPVIFFAVLVIGGALLPRSAEAQGEGWYTCDVHKAGPGWDKVFVTLSCGSGITPRWFVASAGQAKEILATALTAISLTKQVSVYLGGTEQYSEISAFYVTE